MGSTMAHAPAQSPAPAPDSKATLPLAAPLVVPPPAPELVAARTISCMQLMCDHPQVRYNVEGQAIMEQRYPEQLKVWQQLKAVNATDAPQPKYPTFTAHIPQHVGEGFANSFGPQKGCVPAWQATLDPKDPNRIIFTVYDSADPQKTVLATANWEMKVGKPAIYTVTDAGKERLNPPSNAQEMHAAAYISGYADELPLRKMMEDDAKDAGSYGVTNPSGYSHFFQTWLTLKDGATVGLKLVPMDSQEKTLGMKIFNENDPLKAERPLAVCVWTKGTKDPSVCVLTDAGKALLDLSKCAAGKPRSNDSADDALIALTAGKQPEQDPEFKNKVAWVVGEALRPTDEDMKHLLSRSSWLSESRTEQVTADGWDLSGDNAPVSWSGLKAYLTVPAPKGVSTDAWQEERVRELFTTTKLRITKDALANSPDAVSFWKTTLYGWINEEPSWPAGLIEAGKLRP